MSGPGAPTRNAVQLCAHPRTSCLEPALNYRSSKTNMKVNQYYEWRR